jgi:hypothetical protein
VTTSKIDWKAVSEATGDDAGKLAKVGPIESLLVQKSGKLKERLTQQQYYSQTFRKHLEAAVLSNSFGQRA